MQTKKKLNRRDFLFEDGWFETKVKRPGELVMQQFQISDCEQCNILLFDSNACVYVDSCKYCNIFIGPSQSSIFIRDCQSITVVSLSQQFRVRDSFNCHFAIFCQSQPIIESSHHITFSCYPKQFTYGALGQQMKQAGLDCWGNNWFDVYDFTPGKFNQGNNNNTKGNYQISAYQKEVVKLKEIVVKQMREHGVEVAKQPVIPAVEGKLNMQTLQTYTIEQIMFLVITQRNFLPSQVSSLVLQSRHVHIVSQEVRDIVGLGSDKSQKVLFLKIKKQDESRWRHNPKVTTTLKSPKDKQIIQNIVFAPFKDQR